MTSKLNLQQRQRLVVMALSGERSITQICAQVGISRTLFYRWLNRYRQTGQLEPGQPGRPKKKLKTRKKKPQSHEKLSPPLRQQMVSDYVRERMPLAQVTDKYGVSRQTVYRWTNRYLESIEKQVLLGRDKFLKKEKGDWTKKDQSTFRSSRRLPHEYEELVLDAVRQYPELGVAQLAKLVPTVGKKPVISYHAIQRILERYHLSTYQKRYEYARLQQSPFESVVRSVLQKVDVFLSVCARLGLSPAWLLTLVGSTVFFTIVFLGLRSYWDLAVAGKETVYTVGFFFSSVSLFFGMIFFLYSLKYYISLALVLSFSKQKSEGKQNRLENGGQSFSTAGTGLWNWLGQVFGVELTINDQVQKQNLKRRALGLQPDLQSVTLERYPFISIQLPMYNEKRVVGRLIRACSQLEYPPNAEGEANFEIVVCDDSTDDTKKIIDQFAKNWNQKREKDQPRIVVSHREDRAGFKGGALQEALGKMSSKAEFIVVFDADFVPYPDTLVQFVKYFKLAVGSEEYQSSRVAVVGGYQWHVLNKSENWITRGVRAEYAGSYVVERSGREIMGLLKQISGSVYMARADVIKKIGWGKSITEDFEMTLKLYERGYRVVYTPYVQAPAECVSTLKRLIRQRMRWAEGHSNNIRKMVSRLMVGRKVDSEGKRRLVPSPLTLMEKLEVVYLSTYYLQAFF
ncbi:glycosyltransferase, partial [Patescibacteria group bacterium]|nr:glycosyltransferase [Patescibacteria group bacterium]